MRLPTRLLSAAIAVTMAAGTHTPEAAHAGWDRIFAAVGLSPNVRILSGPSTLDPDWRTRVESGGLLILEGESLAATALGFKITPKKLRVTSIIDVHNPKLSIVWES